MNARRLTAGSRLHFGLLAWGPGRARQFGGLGLMVEDPGFSVRIEPGTGRVEGPRSERVRQLIRKLRDPEVRTGFDLTIERAAPEHLGLGSGTQLSLAVARLVGEFLGGTDLSAATLAEATGRGRRSGVGLHGFDRGGLIVDGGRGTDSSVPPLVARLEFPEDWDVALVAPRETPGLHGEAERRAFAELPPCPTEAVDRLCGIVLLELLPAVGERDLSAFGASLEEIQRRVGQAFAPAQGGAFSHPEFDAIARAMRNEGLTGVGQSSWGPTIYGFAAGSGGDRYDRLRDALARGGAGLIVTRARNRGAESGPA